MVRIQWIKSNLPRDGTSLPQLESTPVLRRKFWTLFTGSFLAPHLSAGCCIVVAHLSTAGWPLKSAWDSVLGLDCALGWDSAFGLDSFLGRDCAFGWDSALLCPATGSSWLPGTNFCLTFRWLSLQHLDWWIFCSINICHLDLLDFLYFFKARR